MLFTSHASRCSEYFPGHPSGIIGREKNGDWRDVFWLSDAP